MKRYRITLENHAFDVKVLDDPRRDQVQVEVDGEIFTVGVEVVPVAAETTTPETTRAVGASPAASPRLPKFQKTSEVPAPQAAPAPQAVAAPQAAPAPQAVAAPLPGVIKSIAVRPGQRVAADDELLVIEAMKMDNIIRAPRGGSVGTIHVTEGRQVAYGETLLEMTNEQ
jgi:biotin carboxyl carrier protein